MDDSSLSIAMDAFRRAVGRAGGQKPFERLTGLKQQAVSYRLANAIPLQGAFEVLLVEEKTGVSRHELRPDLYPRDRCFEADCPEHGNPREDGPRAAAGGRSSPVAAGGSSPRDSSAPADDSLEKARA